jgi:hypothetical protein
MEAPSIPLTTLTENQQAQAHTHFSIIRLALENGITQVIRTHNILASTMQVWQMPKTFRQRQIAPLTSLYYHLD